MLCIDVSASLRRFSGILTVSASEYCFAKLLWLRVPPDDVLSSLEGGVAEIGHLEDENVNEVDIFTVIVLQ